MNIVKPLKLQQMAMVSIGQSVWQAPAIKRRIGQIFSADNESGYEMSRYLEWILVTREIYSKLKRDQLPLRLASELFYVVKQMGDHLYDWYHYVERTNKFLYDKCGQKLDHPKKIYWLPCGAINVERVILENWIENVRLENACAVYFVSILHGLDKRRNNDVWNLMPAKLRITCRQILSCTESYASAFLYACVGDPSDSLEIAKKLGYSTIEHKQRFLLFVSKGYLELVKSVWYQLNSSTRDSVVDKGFRLALRRSSSYSNRRFEKRRFDEIALFLYCQMTDQHKCNILCDSCSNHYVTKLLYIVASKPHLGLLMSTLEEVLRHILEDMDYIYSDLVNSLVYDMIEDFDCTYVPRGILVKVWKRLPAEIKREIQFDEIFEGLIDEWDLLSLRALLNVPEFVNEREKLIESLAHCYLKSSPKEGPESLDELAEKVFIRDSDKETFKRKVQDCQAISFVASDGED